MSLSLIWVKLYLFKWGEHVKKPQRPPEGLQDASRMPLGGKGCRSMVFLFIFWGFQWIFALALSEGFWKLPYKHVGEFELHRRVISWIEGQGVVGDGLLKLWMMQPWWCGDVVVPHEFHETCHSITFYLMKKLIFTYLAESAFHQIWLGQWPP